MKEIMHTLSPEQLEWLFHKLSTFEHSLFVICATLLLYAIYLIFRSKRVYFSKSKRGSISLTKRALCELVESLTRETGIQGKISIKISGSRCKLTIDVIIKTGSWQNLSKVSEALHGKLQEILVKNMGLTCINKINIIVVGFLFREKASICTCNDEGESKPSICDCRQD